MPFLIYLIFIQVLDIRFVMFVFLALEGGVCHTSLYQISMMAHSVIHLLIYDMDKW